MDFHRTFKRQFKKLLIDHFDATEVKIGKPNHFDVTGFFKISNTIFYFSLGDLRWMTTFLLRSAKDYDDYTGNTNNYCNIEDDFETFLKTLRSIINNEIRLMENRT